MRKKLTKIDKQIRKSQWEGGGTMKAPQNAIICPGNMYRPKTNYERRNSNCHDKTYQWAENDT